MALWSGQERSSPAPLAKVKGTVADEAGAVIPQSEVVFQGEQGKVVSHTSMDGSVTGQLSSGRYAVTIAKSGFVTAKLVDFQINAPTPREFRVVLRVGHTPSNGGNFEGRPTTTISELPNGITLEPKYAPAPQPATRKKRRSLRCLYLWKCSSSISVDDKSPLTGF
jgi:hypothetical protein